MPKEIYNEGRVVGYSSYEEYVKHALSENPSLKPATEMEWLSSTLTFGSSLILKVTADNIEDIHYRDFPLPQNSRLRACSIIYANIFFGNCICDENGWATKVTDYGAGISNQIGNGKHPRSNSEITSLNTPLQTLKKWINDLNSSTSSDTSSNVEYTYNENSGYDSQVVSTDNDSNESKPADEISQYIKIQDGLVLQPGQWVPTDSGNPTNDLIPDISDHPVIRLIFSGPIKQDFYILFTGYIDYSVTLGSCGLDGALKSFCPEDGDFLGPQIFPWSTKILFNYPPIASYYNRNSMYSKYNNLIVKPSEDNISTEIISSHIIADKGISICGPTTPGGDIKIQSKSKSNNNYIKVEQTTVNDETCDGTKDHDTTTLTHGNIINGKGIGFTAPTTPGGDIKISSITKSKNNYIKVEQGDSKNYSEESTELTASKAESGNGISVIQPSIPGENFTVEISLGEDSGLKFDDDGNLVLDLDSKVVKDSIREVAASCAASAVQQILNRINTTQGTSKLHPEISYTVANDGSVSFSINSWPSNYVLPTGNMNITSSNNAKIHFHRGDSNGDLRVY